MWGDLNPRPLGSNQLSYTFTAIFKRSQQNYKTVLTNDSADHFDHVLQRVVRVFDTHI